MKMLKLRAIFMRQVIYLLLPYTLCAYASQGVKLEKLFHHQGGKAEQSLELGKLELYFSDNPIVTVLPKNSHDKKTAWVHKDYFFPQATVASGVRRLISKMNNGNHEGYHLAFSEVNLPMKGVKLSLAYDPERVSLLPYQQGRRLPDYRLFDTAGLKKGVEFVFYNRVLQQRLNQRSNQPLLQMAALKKKRDVVVDCGHGGADHGATGASGLQEKDITLDVGRRLAALLKENGIGVTLTRSKDTTLPLDARTKLANNVASDLFVSIHANAALNKEAHGIETYIAARPFFCTQASCRSPGDKLILAHYDDRYYKSKELAHLLQEQMIFAAQKYDRHIEDRKVKEGELQVLLGSSMPAALVEIGFVSNKNEEHLLKKSFYRQALAQGLYQGIASFLKKA